jgi:hypothetical protein
VQIAESGLGISLARLEVQSESRLSFQLQEESRSEMMNSMNQLKELVFPQRAGDVVLRDGLTVRVRVMQPEDEPLLFGLFRSLSEDSRWMRFFCLTTLPAAPGHLFRFQKIRLR